VFNQHTAGSLPGQPHEMISSQTENWIKPSYKSGWTIQEGTTTNIKHAKQNYHFTPTPNRYTALQGKEIDKQLPTGNENIPKHPNLHNQCHQHLTLNTAAWTTSPPTIRNLGPRSKSGQNPAQNIRFIRIITITLPERHTEFHTYKLKEKRTYRVVLTI
jgi:hypothetical protein